MTNGVLGTKMKVITGYKGSREVTLAVEKGEVQGICGLGWSTVKVQNPDILAGKSYARVFAQEDMDGHSELNKLGVPLMISLAKTDEDRQAMQMFYAQNGFARPFILPPGVPADRIAVLRQAFEATMKDPELLAEAEKMRIDVEWSTGEAVQALVADVSDAPGRDRAGQEGHRAEQVAALLCGGDRFLRLEGGALSTFLLPDQLFQELVSEVVMRHPLRNRGGLAAVGRLHGQHLAVDGEGPRIGPSVDLDVY